MKNILYKILPVCLLTIGLTGCEDETKYRPLPEAVPLTMSINAIERGDHDSLMEQGGTYYRLYTGGLEID